MNRRHRRQTAGGIGVFALCGIFVVPALTDAQVPKPWAADDLDIAADLEAPVDFRTVAVAGNTVTFAWTQPVGGTAPTGYVIEGGLAPGDVLASIPTPSAMTVVTLSAPDGVFYVRVRAAIGLTTSEPSNEIQVAINVPGPPSAIAGLLGVAEGSSVTLRWQNTFEGGSPAGLVLDVTSHPEPVAVPDQRSVSFSLPVTDRFSFSGVPDGTYSVAVRAVNAFGSSGPSNSVTLTFPGTCSLPGTPTNFAASRIGNTISVTWSPPSSGGTPTGYIVHVARGSIGWWIPTAELSLSGPAPPGVYDLSVAATNACGASAATPPQIVVFPPRQTIILGMIFDESGDCIPGATIQIVRRAPWPDTQTTPCDYWETVGGFTLTGVTAGTEVTLRASAPGYADQEKTVVPTGPGSEPVLVVYFTLSRIE